MKTKTKTKTNTKKTTKTNNASGKAHCRCKSSTQPPEFMAVIPVKMLDGDGQIIACGSVSCCPKAGSEQTVKDFIDFAQSIGGIPVSVAG